MGEETTSTDAGIGRRTLLTTGATLLAGLGTTTSGLARPTPAAPETTLGQQWPLGGPPKRPDPTVQGGEPDSNETDPDQQRTVTDDTGTVQFSVPEAWDDINSTQIGHNPSIIAAPDLDGYLNSWSVPGVEVAVTTRLGSDLETILERLVDYSDECDGDGQRSFRSDEFGFHSQIWTRCSGVESTYLTVVGAPLDEQTDGTPTGAQTDLQVGIRSKNYRSRTPPEDELPTNAPYVILFGAQLVTESDPDAAATALETLEVQSSTGQFLNTG